MTNKVLLSIIWFVSFLSNVIVIYLYNDGIILIDALTEHLEPIIYFYGPYISGILAFWYFKPFKEPKTENLRKIRFVIAIITTLCINAVILYGSLSWFMFQSSIILEDIKDGIQIATWMSFLVAPANAYYFGIKYST